MKPGTASNVAAVAVSKSVIGGVLNGLGATGIGGSLTSGAITSASTVPLVGSQLATLTGVISTTAAVLTPFAVGVGIVCLACKFCSDD
jgi:hypothetical protein